MKTVEMYTSTLETLQVKDFDKVYSIMEESFPIDERRTYEEQKALLDNELYNIYVLYDNENDNIKAFIAIWSFDDFAFVEHLAVSSLYRNGGIGALILQEVKKLLSSMICLEVELPEEEMARRRIGFYERNGFYYNDYEYMQPAISKDRNEIPLRIMTTGGKVIEDRFNEIKSILYKNVYGVE